MNVNTNVYGSYYTGKGLNKNLKLQSDGKKKDVEYVGTKESGKTNNKLSTENEKKLSKKVQDFLKKKMSSSLFIVRFSTANVHELRENSS